MARPRAVPGLDMLQIMPSQEPGWECFIRASSSLTQVTIFFCFLFPATVPASVPPSSYHYKRHPTSENTHQQPEEKNKEWNKENQVSGLERSGRRRSRFDNASNHAFTRTRLRMLHKGFFLPSGHFGAPHRSGFDNASNHAFTRTRLRMLHKGFFFPDTGHHFSFVFLFNITRTYNSNQIAPPAAKVPETFHTCKNRISTSIQLPFTPSASATVPAYIPPAKIHTRNRTVPETEPEPYQKL